MTSMDAPAPSGLYSAILSGAGKPSLKSTSLTPYSTHLSRSHGKQPNITWKQENIWETGLDLATWINHGQYQNLDFTFSLDILQEEE